MRAIDLAHPARAENGADLVRTETRADSKGHSRLIIVTERWPQKEKGRLGATRRACLFTLLNEPE